MATKGRTDDLQMDPVIGPSDPQRDLPPTYSRTASRRKLTRGKSLKRGVSVFFLGEDEVDNKKWRNRSMRLHSKSLVGGSVRSGLQAADTVDSVFDATDGASQSSRISRPLPQPIDPLARPRALRQDSKSSRGSYFSSRQISRISTASTCRRSMRWAPQRKVRKDSVLKMAYDGVREMVSPTKKRHKPAVHNRSFAPGSISEHMCELDGQKSPTAASSDISADDTFLDDVFFDTPTPTSYLATPFAHPRALVQMGGAAPEALSTIDEKSPRAGEVKVGGGEPDKEAYFDEKDGGPPALPPKGWMTPEGIPVAVRVEEDKDFDFFHPTRPTRQGWQIGREKPPPAPETGEDMLDLDVEGMKRMGNTMIDSVFDNSNRREVGKGFMGNLLDRRYNMDRMNSEVKAQIEIMEDHRPYFTYWVTFVQILVFIIAVAVYGIAPIGFEETQISGEVLTPNLAIEKVSYFEIDNLWIGPRQADLIHLGAKYSPCMRKDSHIEAAIKKDVERESGTACCIRNDGSGCIQSIQGQCSATLSYWFKYTQENPGLEDRVSGSVCGQEPMYCKNPESSGAYVWPDDITSWPICKESIGAPTGKETAHLTCKLVGRPCCVGIEGQCIITTREYCQFRRGYFHEEATLCSQISCMDEICGMIPFIDPSVPDQFYRLWTSLFLHAGFFQLLVTVLFQVFVMRDLEKLAGWLRITIIYIGSGIAGSLASAIFLPYHVEAGPAGSQFGLVACLFVDVLHNWQLIQRPWWEIAKLGLIVLALFVIGLLPFVDNYAHLIGFIIGFLLSFALLPYVTFNKLDKRNKIIGIVVCLLASVGLFVLLIILFYVTPVYDCPYCHYFNCIPFTDKFCQNMKVQIERDYRY